MKKAIIIILIIIGVFQIYQHINKKTSSNNDASSDQVILFTAENCPPCDDAEMFLDENEIEYTLYNIDESEENMRKFKEYKGTKFPLIIVGDQRLEGYSEILLRGALSDLYGTGLNPTDVVVYTSNGCGWCKKTINFLDRLNIEYSERNISESEEDKEEFQELGGRGTPLILIGDNKIWGYDEKAIKTALKQAGLM